MKPFPEAWFLLSSLIYPLTFLVASGIAAAHVLPTSMRSDSIEYDQKESNYRQKGAYAAIAVFYRKTITSIGIGIFGLLLERREYVAGVALSDAVLSIIRSFMGPLPIVTLIVVLILLWLYPVSRSSHRELVESLEGEEHL